MARTQKQPERGSGIRIIDMVAEAEKEGRSHSGKRWMVWVRNKRLRKYEKHACDDWDQAMEWAKDRQAKLATGQIRGGRTRVRDLLTEFQKRLRSDGRSEDHIASYEGVVARMEEWGCFDLAHDDFRERFQHGLDTATMKSGKALSKSYKTKLKTQARTLCKFAVEERRVAYNPLDGVRTPTGKNPTAPWLVDELRTFVMDKWRFRDGDKVSETYRVLDECGGDTAEAASVLGVSRATVYNHLKQDLREEPFWFYCVLLAYTGLRPTEAALAQWEWINWEEQLLELPEDADGNKTNEPRDVPIEPELMDLLIERAGPTYREASGFICDEQIPSMEKADRSRGFARYCNRIGVNRVNRRGKARGLHSFRSSRGCILLMRHPNNILSVMMPLGHTDVKVARGYARDVAQFKRHVRDWDDRVYLRPEACDDVIRMPVRSG